jgi:hypothetical protein
LPEFLECLIVISHVFLLNQLKCVLLFQQRQSEL